MSQQIKYEDEIINEIRDMSDEQIRNILNIFKKSIIMQRDEDFYLKKELDEWDTLSGEALKNFES